MPCAQVIIHADRIYLKHGSERARLIPTYHSLIQRVRLRVRLPDMVLPLNPGAQPGSCVAAAFPWCCMPAPPGCPPYSMSTINLRLCMRGLACTLPRQVCGRRPGCQRCAYLHTGVYVCVSLGEAGCWASELIRQVGDTTTLNGSVLRMHAGDEPLAPLQAAVQPPTPIFSFCKQGAGYSDIMLPNTIEGDVFVRPLDKRAFRPRSRAGAVSFVLNMTAPHAR